MLTGALAAITSVEWTRWLLGKPHKAVCKASIKRRATDELGICNVSLGCWLVQGTDFAGSGKCRYAQNIVILSLIHIYHIHACYMPLSSLCDTHGHEPFTNVLGKFGCIH